MGRPLPPAPRHQETRQLLASAKEHVERDRCGSERADTDRDRSNHLRGRLPAWREIQQLAEPLRTATVDGKPVA